MRLILFFDLPVETALQRKSYRSFKAYLLKEGFIMLQESVYVRLTLDDMATKALISRLRLKCPKAGLVQVMKVTEKQFTNMCTLVGNNHSEEYEDSTDRLVII